MRGLSLASGSVVVDGYGRWSVRSRVNFEESVHVKREDRKA